MSNYTFELLFIEKIVRLQSASMRCCTEQPKSKGHKIVIYSVDINYGYNCVSSQKLVFCQIELLQGPGKDS